MAIHQKDDDYLKERFRAFVVQRNYYYDTHDYDAKKGDVSKVANAMSEEEWKDMIIKLFDALAESAEYAYYIFHDKDKLADGSDKPLHVHGVFKFKNPRYVGSVYKALGISRIENITKVKSYKGALKYLLHITDQARKDGKHVYDQSLLMSGGNLFTSENESIDPVDYYNDLTGKIDETESMEKEAQKIAIKAARDVLYEARRKGTSEKVWKEKIVSSVPKEYAPLADDVYSTYKHKLKEAEREYFTGLAIERSLKGRNLTVCQIYGEGGSGKTKLAKALGERLANERGLHDAAAQGKEKTVDFVSKYRYQNVTLMNEVKGTFFEPREFMNNFDNYNYSPINSRHSDVDWLADYVVFTTSRTLQNFRNECFRYSLGGSELVDVNEETNDIRIKRTKSTMDEAFQFTRRITHYIKIEEIKEGVKMIYVHIFNESKKGYTLQKIIKTNGEFYLDENECNKVVNKIIECFEDKTLDIYDGQVIQDDDLIQNKKDVYDYEPPETESDKLWKSIHKKHNNIELYRQSKEKQKLLQPEPVTPTEEAKSYNPFNV